MFPVLVEVPMPGFVVSLAESLGFEFDGGLDIYSYGVMLGTSMILAWYAVMWLGEREGFSRDTLANVFIVTALSAIAGSRVLYIVTNPDEFNGVASWFAIRQGGLVAYGGFLGGFAAAWVMVRRSGQGTLLQFADVAAPTLALGLALTRVGCYLYGCDFGRRLEADAPSWLQSLGTFPHWADDSGSPAWSHHVADEGLDWDATHSYPVHPTQIYESLIGFTLLAITILVWRRRLFHGHVLLVLALAYGVWRFLIEYVRDDPGRGAAFGFSTSQLISMAIVPIAGFFLFQGWKAARAEPMKVWRLGEPPLVPLAPAGGAPAPAIDASEEPDDAPRPAKKPAAKAGSKKKKKR